MVHSEDRRHRGSTRGCSERNNRLEPVVRCAIVLMFSSAAPIGGRPTAQFSIADIAKATRSMFIPVGLRARKKLDCQLPSAARSSVFPSAQSSWLVDQAECQAARLLATFRESTARWYATHVAGEHKITSFKNGAIRSHIDCRTPESRGGGVLRQRLRHRVSPTRSPPRIYSGPRAQASPEILGQLKAAVWKASPTTV